MRAALESVRESPHEPSRLTDIMVHIDADSEQEGADGVTFTLGIANRGDAASSLLNPFDNLKVQLLDPHGFPLRLPTRPSGLRRYADKPGEWAFVPPFPVVGATRNGSSVDPEELGERVLSLGASEECAMSFLVAPVIDGGTDRSDAPGDRAKGSLPDGRYQVRCVATLINADQPQDTRILQSPKIAIRLARRP